MRSVSILGVLLVTACGGKLNVGNDASGGVGGGGDVSTGGNESTTSGGSSSKGQGGSSSKGEGGSSFGGKSDSSAGGKSSSSSGGSSSVPDAAGCSKVEPIVTSGVWRGYSEDFLFMPIDQYVVTIAGVGANGALCGEVRFGDAPALEPARDRDQVYPPGSDPIELKGGIQQLWPGATYSISAGGERAGVLRFQVHAAEVRQSWCELQTSYQLPDTGEYSCMPSRSFGISTTSDGVTTCETHDDDGNMIVTSLAQCLQCRDCACDADGCSAVTSGTVQFDLVLDDSNAVLSGSVAGTALRLTRRE